MNMSNKTPEQYIAELSPDEQAEFDRIKQIVLKYAPDAELVMSYGLPTFKLNKKVVVHFGAFKDHLSLFPGSTPIAELQHKLTDFKTAKGTIRFTLDHPIPDELLNELIAFCAERAGR